MIGERLAIEGPHRVCCCNPRPSTVCASNAVPVIAGADGAVAAGSPLTA